MTTSGSLFCNYKKNYTTLVTVKKRLTKVERSKINIESPLNEIIIGLLLGDGHTLKDNVEMVVVDLFMVKVV